MTIQEKFESFVKEFNEEDARFDDQFEEFHKSEKKKAIKRGKNDAQQSVPASDRNTLTPAEQEIKSSYEQKMDTVSNMGKPYLDRIHQEWFVKYANILEDSDEDQNARRLVKLEDQRKEEIEELKKERNEKICDLENASRFVKPKKDYREFKPKFEAMLDEEGRRKTDAVLNSSFYWPIMIFVAAAEVTINYFVFELMGESKELTWLFSSSVGVVIAFAGHFCGSELKRLKKGKWLKISLLVGIALLIGGISLTIADMREYFVLKQGLMPDALADSAGWLFFFITILFFAVASWASYNHHDSNPEFIAMKNQLNKLKETLEKTKEQLDIEIQQVKEVYRSKIKDLNETYDIRVYNVEDEEKILKSLIQDIIGHYNAILVECKSLERKINSSFKEAIWSYRQTNLQIRSGDNEPEMWSNNENDLELRKPMNDMEKMTDLKLNKDINLS